MIKIAAVFAIFLCGLFIDTPSSINLRASFYAAAKTENAAQSLAKKVAGVRDHDKAILLCYKGASAMMEAKYKVNPIAKMTLFKKGKTYIEKAVYKDPKNMEIRFIRLAIQENLPSFLGYDEHIETDKQFLKQNLHKLKDKSLEKDISAYLSLGV